MSILKYNKNDLEINYESELISVSFTFQFLPRGIIGLFYRCTISTLFQVVSDLQHRQTGRSNWGKRGRSDGGKRGEKERKK